MQNLGTDDYIIFEDAGYSVKTPSAQNFKFILCIIRCFKRTIKY